MSRSFLHRLPLSRSEIDRDNLIRERSDLVEFLDAEPRTRSIVLSRGRALLQWTATEDAPPALALLPLALIPTDALQLFLGTTVADTETDTVGTPIVASIVSPDVADTVDSDESHWANLRVVADTLSDRDAGLFTEALALANWHESHAFSPRNGSETRVEKGGWVRHSELDNTDVFPRTDPAVIMSILDADDRILLGSNAMWENNRYSLLAGFVEPGESLESAVLRESFEESGLRVVDPEYLGSQPWPFPASIMLGFRCRLAADQDPAELRPDGEEILDLRWFSRDELRAEMSSILLPGPSSIARAIIDEWLTDGS